MTTSKRHFLLVEDNRADVRLFREAFREVCGVEWLHAACDATQAWAFLKNEPPYESAPRPDIVVLDVALPGMSGLDLLRQIRGDPQLRTIPVVVFSSQESPRSIRDFYEAGIGSFIRKPIEYEAYVRIIRKLVDFYCDEAVVSESQIPRTEDATAAGS